MMALRGIGYHHGSMATKERQVVEMLFRLGYIKVGKLGSVLFFFFNFSFSIYLIKKLSCTFHQW